MSDLVGHPEDWFSHEEAQMLNVRFNHRVRCLKDTERVTNSMIREEEIKCIFDDI